MKILAILSGLVLSGGDLWAQGYDQPLVVTQSIAAGSVTDQQAVSTILASNQVSRGATAVYTAGQSVTLQPGFVTQAGSVFTALIAPVKRIRSSTGEPVLSLRAYPNPFLEKTTMEYTLPGSGTVKHQLLDVQGNPLRSVNDGTEEQSGTHQLSLDGSGLPAGVYLYRIEAGNQSQTLRLVKNP